jgi:hypothetical protein
MICQLPDPPLKDGRAGVRSIIASTSHRIRKGDRIRQPVLLIATQNIAGFIDCYRFCRAQCPAGIHGPQDPGSLRPLIWIIG